jgi:hypothetical protein
MILGLTPSARVLALVCSAALLFVSSQSAPPPPATQPYVYTGTVRTVEPKTGSLDLITGVGYALRLVHITTLPATQTMSSGAAIRFADIKPGDILRADCRMTDTGLVADRIEKLPPPSGTGP